MFVYLCLLVICLTTCAYWWYVWLPVPTGDMFDYLCLLVICLTTCAYWWYVWLPVPTGDMFVYLCLLEICLTTCAYWWYVWLPVPTGDMFVYLCLLVIVLTTYAYWWLSKCKVIVCAECLCRVWSVVTATQLCVCVLAGQLVELLIEPWWSAGRDGEGV